jgi:hypothetical protein
MVKNLFQPCGSYCQLMPDLALWTRETPILIHENGLCSNEWSLQGWILIKLTIPPGAMGVGVGQRRPRRGVDAQVDQLDRPLPRYSVRVSWTMHSNSSRGMSLRIWLIMLHDAFMLDLLGSGNRAFADSLLPMPLDGPTSYPVLGKSEL